MWHETDMTPTDFQEWFEKDGLGKLYFPVGKAYIPNERWFEHEDIVDFFIELKDLYELVTGWKINKQDVLISEIIAIIAMGSAIGPTYKIIRTGKKYIIFGDKIPIKEKIQPQDADFLVITRKNMINEKVLKPLSLETYDCGTWITKGGIHLVNRGREQVINGYANEDTISINALHTGIIVFSIPEELDAIYEDIDRDKITYSPLWNMKWAKSKSGKLIGDIA